MVYRGKPSAGCENCRKAKKRCTLEQPACARCTKLGKTCSGYRDTTQLQIQDESEAVIFKATRQKPHAHTLAPPPPRQQSKTPELGLLTPGTTDSDYSSFTDGDVDVFMHCQNDAVEFIPTDPVYDMVLSDAPYGLDFTFNVIPKPEELAMNYFVHQFRSPGSWSYIVNYTTTQASDQCLVFAVQACGMAALDNVDRAIGGKGYSRKKYVQALSLLNDALRDPQRCKKDESLLAVALLGYYENLTCDSRESVQSWKAHMNGASQLLNLRGKAQFQTPLGRALFRELRGQILINCIWEDIEPPHFMMEWNDDLNAFNDEMSAWAKYGDSMVRIVYDYACLRSAMRFKTISDVSAADEASKLDTRMIQWSINALEGEGSLGWKYTELEVQDSPHVWNGMVHSYKNRFAPSAWNVWRLLRIMITRTQELLVQRFQFTDADVEEQKNYFRKVRRQMTDEICATIPVQLGHASPAMNSACVFITGYAAIWPLFLAGTCALERVSVQPGTSPFNASAPPSFAAAQAAWIIGRMEYIANDIGMKWASGIAAVLKGDFGLHDDLLPDTVEDDPTSTWLRQIQRSGRGTKILGDPEHSLDDGLPINAPVWRGRAVGENPRLG